MESAAKSVGLSVIMGVTEESPLRADEVAALSSIPEQLKGITDSRAKTKATLTQLAEIFEGDTEVSVKSNENYQDVGVRRYELWTNPNKAKELKFGNDPVSAEQVNKDIYYRKMGKMGGYPVTKGVGYGFRSHIDIEYHLMPDHTTGAHVSDESLGTTRDEDLTL